MLHTIPRIAYGETLVEAGSLVEELVGNTPLVRLRRVAEGISPAVHVLGKAEWFNPGGSVKDRPARNIIRQAIDSGALDRDKVLIDATSGNTGIGYAMIGAALGYRVKLVLPADVSSARLGILRAYGAELVFTDPKEGMDGAITEVRKMVQAEPGRYFYADQYSNPANWQAHYATTGPEIWHQTGGQVTHFVAGMGTSGTMMGVGRYLRTVSPTVRLIASQPKGPGHGIEGLKHMESAIVPSIYDPSLIDEIRVIETEKAHEMVRRLAREEGLFVGVSSGAAVTVALRVARALDHGTVVTVLPDGGYKYLGESFWRTGRPKA